MTTFSVQLAASIALILNVVPASLGAQVQVEQAEIAKVLAKGTLEDRMTAHRLIRQIPVSQRQPYILTALTQELDRLDQYLRERRLAIARGEPLESAEEVGEYIFSVIQVVSDYKDPAIIRPLLPFLGTGSNVINLIVAFGDTAVQQVVDFAGTASADDPGLLGTLLALERLLVSPALSEDSRQSIIKVADQRLMENQPPLGVLDRAIALALATGDSALLTKVWSLANDPVAVQNLGITDPSLVTRIQQMAASRLAPARR